jgi:hypothetical protein
MVALVQPSVVMMMSRGDENKSRIAEEFLHHSYGGDGVGVLRQRDHLVNGEHIEIGEIDRQISADDDENADGERQWNGALRVFDLVADEADVEPALVGPKGRQHGCEHGANDAESPGESFRRKAGSGLRDVVHAAAPEGNAQQNDERQTGNHHTVMTLLTQPPCSTPR